MTPRRATVVLPARDEAETIGAVVAGFRAQPWCERVWVVANACQDATAARARAAGAEVIEEPRPGYGRALRTGIDGALAAGAQLLVLGEADGSFDPRDGARLLALLERVDLALGSRTQPAYLAPGAAMGPVLRLGNRLTGWALARLHGPRGLRLGDAGCTLRAFSGETWRRVRARVEAAGPAFAPLLVCAALRSGLSVGEVPVHYGPRLGGRSKHGGRPLGNLRTACAMWRAIVRSRFAPPA